MTGVFHSLASIRAASHSVWNLSIACPHQPTSFFSCVKVIVSFLLSVLHDPKVVPATDI
jgi:hypothetical protein